MVVADFASREQLVVHLEGSWERMDFLAYLWPKAAGAFIIYSFPFLQYH